MHESFEGKSQKEWVVHIRQCEAEWGGEAAHFLRDRAPAILSILGSKDVDARRADIIAVGAIAISVLLGKFKPGRTTRASALPSYIKGRLMFRIIDLLRSESRDRIARDISRAVRGAENQLHAAGVVRPTSAELTRAAAKLLPQGKTRKHQRKLARRKPAHFLGLRQVQTVDFTSVAPLPGAEDDGELEFDAAATSVLENPTARAAAAEFFRRLFAATGDRRELAVLFLHLIHGVDQSQTGMVLKFSASRASQLYGKVIRRSVRQVCPPNPRPGQKRRESFVGLVREGASRLWHALPDETRHEIVTEFGLEAVAAS